MSVEKSTHQCPCFPFDIDKTEKHPNADLLQTWKIPGSEYTYVLNRADWADYKGLVIWMPPDSLVDTGRPEFNFLAKDAKYAENSETPGPYARIKAKKLRGIISYGLCVKAPQGAIEGPDQAELLGVKHYEPEMTSNVSQNKLGIGGNEIAPGPNVYTCKYDVDAFLKYGKVVFNEGELVNITEKLHGCNGAFVYSEGEFHCKSRTEWKREYASPPNITIDQLIDNMKRANEKRPEPETEDILIHRAYEIFDRAVVNFKPKQNKWWWVLRNTLGLMEFLQAYPNTTVFGEVYGDVKGFPYDRFKDELKFRVFDIMKDGKFLDVEDARQLGKYLPWVPVLKDKWPLDFNQLEQFYIGKSTLNDKHTREGCVIRPMKEEWNKECGRKLLKLVSPEYFERS